MVKETSVENRLVFLVQVKDKNLEYLLSKPVKEGNLQLKSVENSSEVDAETRPDHQIIAFVIGSNVEDPIQSTQRLHALDKNATIIILSEPQRIESLKEAIKLSPFIGVEVYCVDTSQEAMLEKELDEILQKSHQAAKYRDVIAETNKKISLESSAQKSIFTKRFINRLMDIAPIGIAIVAQSGKILGWNKEATSIFEKSESEVLGTLLSEYFDQAESEKLDNYLKRIFKKTTSGSDNPLSLKRKLQGKHKQHLSFTAAPFTYSDGSEKALILAFKDVTARKQAQEDLQQINETLEQRVEERTASLLSYQKQLRSLASQLSKAEEQERQRLATEIHDNLGQMLAVNKMKLDSLPQDQLPGDIAEQINDVKQGIDDSIEYARNLMSDLKPPPSLDKEDVKATIAWLAKKMEKHDLKVDVKDDGRPKKATEEIRTTLLQCIREILFNVIRHAEVNKAFIDMSRIDNEVQIIVKDKGIGFDPESDATNVSDNGGFGLFNIRERIDLLGGQVDIDSKPGKGTKVTLTAPLKQEVSPDIAAGDDKTTDVTREKSDRIIKVMLVDDHKMVRSGLKKIVDGEDDMTVVAEASDGKEAVELAHKQGSDIIIMDVNMPNMNGIDAIKEIMSSMSNVRIIGLSLHNQPEVVKSMKSAGATAYLSKSEAFETLSATIRTEAEMVK